MMRSVVLLFVIFVSSSFCEDTCVQKSPCICQFPNGTGIDLTPTAKASFLETETFQPKLNLNVSQLVLTKFYYHPCIDIAKIFSNVSTPSNTDTCSNTALSICRHVTRLTETTKNTYTSDGGIYELMGKNLWANFSTDGKYITYMNILSTNIILLTCTDGDDQLGVFSLEDPQQIKLSFFSRHACLKLIEEPGRSVGSTLLIIFFSMVIFYLVLGVCTKKFLMGATGLEVIPNLGFWTDLPNLVKDGWAFTLNGFKLPARGAAPATSPDPNSYDSI